MDEPGERGVGEERGRRGGGKEEEDVVSAAVNLSLVAAVAEQRYKKVWSAAMTWRGEWAW